MKGEVGREGGGREGDEGREGERESMKRALREATWCRQQTLWMMVSSRELCKAFSY